MKTTHLVMALGIASVVAAAACGGTEAETTTSQNVRTVPVHTVKVQTRDLSETLTLTGTLDPRAEVSVTPEVSARLERVMKNEGDRVWKGQAIATLDSQDFRLARDRARAMLAIADANRAHARAENERAESLLKTGGITDKDRLSAQVAVQVADASYAQAASEVAIAERQLNRTAIVAPLSGRISKRLVDAGAMVAATTPIYTIVDDSQFEFRASVASGDFGKLHVGEKVTVTADALPGFVTEGEVNRITPQIDARSRSFEVIVRVPGRPELVSGLFTRGEVHVRDVPGSLVVPPAALVRDGADPSRAQAFVVVNGKAERRDVTVGVEVADAIQVTSGLKAGEVVVLDPPSALGPGTQVQIQGS
ncbi:MAG TPA: efflux RND transporter periplasmic adaptor subunit [Vicinamibacterales bacterium]|nr:efflux RND transporter periplasmic adaptor subunit [Vicinamibacterales bacterium]